MGRSTMDGTPAYEQIEFLERKNAELEAANNAKAITIERLAEQVVELEEDAERLQYLIDNFVSCWPDMSGNHTWMGIGRRIGEGRTLREAIDKAMGK